MATSAQIIAHREDIKQSNRPSYPPKAGRLQLQLLANADERGGQKSMWTVSVLGQSPRELRDGASGFGVSPDGTHVAFSPGGASDYVREIWVMGSQVGQQCSLRDVRG